MIESSHKELLSRFIEDVWNGGAIDAVDRYLGEGYTIHHDPGDPWHGRFLTLAQFKDRVRVARAPFPDQRFDLHQLFEDGGAVVATWHWSGTHTGELNGFPPSGKQIKMSGATVYYFEAERITGHWQTIDRLGGFQQLRAA